MTVLIDTNVTLDEILKNAAGSASSRAILDLAEQKRFIGYISASAITDIFYLTQKRLGKKIAKEVIKELLHIFRPATVTGEHIYHALAMDWSDFEDAVQFVVGESLFADYIITRNTKDFSGDIPAITPEQFLALL